MAIARDDTTAIASEIQPPLSHAGFGHSYHERDNATLLQAGFCHSSLERDDATAITSMMMPQLSQAR